MHNIVCCTIGLKTFPCLLREVPESKLSCRCGSRIWSRGGPQLLRPKVADIACYDMGQNDTIDKIELKPSIILSSDNTNCKNDIQLFHQLFDELSVYRDYH